MWWWLIALSSIQPFQPTISSTMSPSTISQNLSHNLPSHNLPSHLSSHDQLGIFYGLQWNCSRWDDEMVDETDEMVDEMISHNLPSHLPSHLSHHVISSDKFFSCRNSFKKYFHLRFCSSLIYLKRWMMVEWDGRSFFNFFISFSTIYHLISLSLFSEWHLTTNYVRISNVISN